MFYKDFNISKIKLIFPSNQLLLYQCPIHSGPLFKTLAVTEDSFFSFSPYNPVSKSYQFYFLNISRIHPHCQCLRLNLFSNGFNFPPVLLLPVSPSTYWFILYITSFPEFIQNTNLILISYFESFSGSLLLSEKRSISLKLRIFMMWSLFPTW